MSLDYTKFNAFIEEKDGKFVVRLADKDNGRGEAPQTFDTKLDAQNYLDKKNLNQIFDTTKNQQNNNTTNPATPSDIPSFPDTNDTQSKLNFVEECRERDLYVEDGQPITEFEPEPLDVEETQGDSVATDLKSPKEAPDYKPERGTRQVAGPSSPVVSPKTNDSQKANIDDNGMRRTSKSALNIDPQNLGGVLGTQLREANPKFKKLEGDQVWSGLNNQWIIFTRDRPGNINTGYQALGHTQAGAMDLVVGRMSPHPREVDSLENPLQCGPIFISETDRETGREVVDAARIYMSQKTDIDINFGLAKGYMGNKNTQSGIGIKADAVRIISRSGGIKMVTHTPRETNSQGAKNNTESPGVEIIAGNDDENLQPMVLGENLRELLILMLNMIGEINGTLSSITTDLQNLNGALSNHNHFGGDGVPTTPSLELQIQCIANLVKLTSVDTYSEFCHNWNNFGMQNTYLGTSNKKSQKSILSKSNRVN